MNPNRINRRQFIRLTTTFTGAAIFTPSLAAAAAPKRTATDIVELGRTGLKISRLGFGAGSNSGRVQHNLGQEAFNKLIRYAYDRGITYIDCAQSYRTFEWIGEAIKGLPREKIFLQTKIPGKTEDALAAIDRHRKVYNTDYLDSVLIHCMVKAGWTDAMKRMMDAFDEAKSRKWIRAKGVSCHSLPALQCGAASDWTEVHLVRINPQGHVMDTPEETWNAKSDGSRVGPVMTEIKKMHAKGHGVIGMKLIGNGDFTNAEDREKAIRFVMAQPEIHAVVIGFKSAAEIDAVSYKHLTLPTS
ncbi:MAG: aldo/keto reductase, partial [Verrucomicrobiae bacterium]|nr:aldo/keto reductase [Verrucomicrobiae bacterium]